MSRMPTREWIEVEGVGRIQKHATHLVIGYTGRFILKAGDVVLGDFSERADAVFLAEQVACVPTGERCQIRGKYAVRRERGMAPLG